MACPVPPFRTSNPLGFRTRWVLIRARSESGAPRQPQASSFTNLGQGGDGRGDVIFGGPEPLTLDPCSPSDGEREEIQIPKTKTQAPKKCGGAALGKTLRRPDTRRGDWEGERRDRNRLSLHE